jgi:hypothetical protein
MIPVIVPDHTCPLCNGSGVVDVETGVELWGRYETREELCECVIRQMDCVYEVVEVGEVV